MSAAVREQAVQAGQSTPAVRADWRLAQVDTVGAAGTVTTTDGIIARRMESYQYPAVGDTIRVQQSSAGSWVTDGRLGDGSGGWTAISLSAGWTWNTGYYEPAVMVHGDGTASLCGLAQMSGTLAAGAVVATLPAGAIPQKQIRKAVQVAVGFFGVMTLLTNGQVQLGDFSGTLATTGNKYAEYDVMSRYRLR
jgi:hypothetical protein